MVLIAFLVPDDDLRIAVAPSDLMRIDGLYEAAVYIDVCTPDPDI